MTVPKWWQYAIGYQVYPRSFADSNGDGIGDLPGVIEKLDYLKWLGINTLWLSPFFPSPNFDCGYDVANYLDVDPEYGTLEDFDKLVLEAHRRDIRIVLDLVLNHTSDQHRWFLESRSSHDNPYRDWYIWRDGKGAGEPPNDWESIFGGSAWEYDPTTQQYYYHYFFPEQPDLNWRNPAVRQAMLDTMRFWMDRDVDGFRLDAIGAIFEIESMPDSGVEEKMEDIFLGWTMGIWEGTEKLFLYKQRHQNDLAENHTVMQALRKVVEEYEHVLLLGETEDVTYYGNGDDELHSVFNFDLIKLAGKLNAPSLRQIMAERQRQIPPGVRECNTIGNHDRSRSYTFYGDGKADEARLRAMLALTMFLEGTPMFYNGEEIGMRDYFMPTIQEFRDNLGVWVYHALQAKRGLTAEEALRVSNIQGRDKCRTPMQWDNTPNAGFSPAGVTTWLPVNPDFAEGVNVREQTADPNSLLHYFRQLALLRQGHEALNIGTMTILDETGDILAFWRTLPTSRLLVAINMAAGENTLTLAEATGQIIFTTSDRATNDLNLSEMNLAPYEVVLVKVE